ncbi:hypothetical protein M0638_20130 [Roseomonas sp. NAR14]|uniref:Uncharacterized protein n=1 Tax=Roseomonas acroporae TaxID=2937791 RepID=A0A9X2BVH1_9PROT|nr:hypothetical protein [Roseomonas acroporae]MCK8786687.1 hypothetical protein [Roseomonas acroporae]
MRERDTEHGRHPQGHDADGHGIGWATLLPLCCIVVLAVATLVAGIQAAMSTALRPVPGDMLRVAARSDAPSGTRVVFVARRPDGAACQIGLGEAADAGGSLLVVGRDAEGGIAAVWASTGRSANAGTDCGNGAELRMAETQFRALQGAARLNPSLSRTGLSMDAPLPMMP